MYTIDDIPDEYVEDDDLVQATIFDLGGQEALRDDWVNYIKQSDVVLFVIDNANSDRFEEAKVEFHRRIIPNIQDKHCLIIGNKYDLVKENSTD